MKLNQINESVLSLEAKRNASQLQHTGVKMKTKMAFL